jgi:hypothetical protein
MKNYIVGGPGRLLDVAEIYCGSIRTRWFFWPVAEWNWRDWNILFFACGFIFGCSCPWFTFDLAYLPRRTRFPSTIRG